MILPGQKRAATVAINSYGKISSITKPVDEDNATSGYGKKSEESFTQVATEPVVRIYKSGNDPEQSRVSGGEYRTDSPLLIFIADSTVSEGYRISYGTGLYEVDSLKFYPTHTEATTTVVG